MGHDAEVSLTIQGQVQGVTFRVNVRKWAQELNLVGYVMNKPDGSVLVLAQGPRQSVLQLIELCRRGPVSRNPFSLAAHVKVDSVDIIWSKPIETFESFEIKH